ncbi:tetraacyldisaccharide 4'-kinase [Azoarcus taiwanensis]|uniref:Tetraacyldisaccharide 4'-kinase n=1 Tax=Azoarcus taiwanensis TaxID=666964 RepID=A0A972JAI4_9RHOO|nr:tetraacyldisaccharide 4'-kinase [Azoarcus taiwanensis]NMG02452.1 tetraacyldisaccharide 4'-kinase [Azoarcus taiwanensis]
MLGEAPRFWRSRSPAALALLPLTAVFAGVAAMRRALFRLGALARVRLPVPVIVVGNIAVGGSGKTPLVQWLVVQLRDAGYKPGIVSRGYGSAAKGVRKVGPDSTPGEVGDEPLLLARTCGCPVAVGADRPAAAALLVSAGCDVIVSDDGLQHYRMHRDVEIVVVDKETLGNRLLLPSGPLREPVSRLATADLLIVHGELDAHLARRCGAVPVKRMRLVGDTLVPLGGAGGAKPLEAMRGCRVHAFAGIGRPSRFFAQLQRAGLEVVPHAFPDHHRFVPEDFAVAGAEPKILTAKDAVKCEPFGLSDTWVLPVSAEIEAGATERILEKLKHGREAA